MKERPILFQADMVLAILEGRKTQTRRVVKPSVKGCTVGAYIFPGKPTEPINVQEDGDPWDFIACPYGQPGDRLWVRETFGNGWTTKPVEGDKICYRATPLESQGFQVCYKWRPSNFMPRWASRITLEIVSVRVERLQEISEEDARAEGVTIKPDAEIAARVAGDTAGRMEYWALWERINGKGSWEKNPWVWRIEFQIPGAAMPG